MCKIKYRKLLLFFIPIIIYFTSFFFRTEYSNRVQYSLLTISLLLYCLFHIFLFRFQLSKKTIVQILILNHFLLVCFLLVFASNYTDLIQNNLKFLTLLIVLHILTFLFASISSVVLYVRRYHFSFGSHMNGLFLFLTKHKYLILLIIITILSSVELWDDFLRWDSSQYLLNFSAKKVTSLFILNDLALYGHISYCYTAFLIVVNSIFRNAAFSLILSNVILLCLSSCAFYGILKHFIPNKSDLFYTAGTAVYTLSPFALGIVGYVSTDYPLLCFFLMLLYAILYKQYIVQFILAFMLCFTKEPGIILCFALYFGFYLIDFIEYKKEPVFFKRILKSLNPYYAVILASAAAFWLLSFLTSGYGWSSANAAADYNTFSFSFPYIISKLKVMYIMNFNWLFSLFFVLLCFLLFKKSNRSEMKYLLPLLTANIVNLLFNCLYITANQPRYISIHIVLLYLSFIITISILLKHTKLQIIIIGLCSVLLYLQSFLTVDPLSMKAFSTINIGSKTMLTIGNPHLNDGIVYNRQYSYLDTAIDASLAEIFAKDQSGLILFPTRIDYGCKSWEFGGVWDSVQFWNEKTLSRNIQNQGIPIDLHYINTSTDIASSFPLYSDAYYISVPCYEAEIYDSICSSYEIIEEQTMEYKGWNLQIVHFKLP